MLEELEVTLLVFAICFPELRRLLGLLMHGKAMPASASTPAICASGYLPACRATSCTTRSAHVRDCIPAADPYPFIRA